jgi:integrase
MSTDLRAAATAYLLGRRARGYRLIGHEPLISSFLDGLAAQNAVRITRINAVAFATAPAGVGRAWQAFRMSTIQGFAAYVHGIDPEAAELIPAGLVTARPVRGIPYLYSAGQISELMSRSTALLSARRGLTMGAYVGLIAATGLRSGEAIALDDEDFLPDQGLLNVTGKYSRQRVLPLHPTTIAALLTYRQTRTTMHATAARGPMFLGHTGKRLNHNSARAAFRQVANECDLPTSPGCRLPRLHDLRHTFAVNTLIDAHRHEADVDARIAALATYLGHVDPLNTYWYLSASAELMRLVNDRTATYRQARR